MEEGRRGKEDRQEGKNGSTIKLQCGFHLNIEK